MRRRWLVICMCMAAVVVLSGVMWRMGAGATPEVDAAANADHDHAGEAPGAHEGEAAAPPAVPGLQTRCINRSRVNETIALTGEIQHDADRSARVGSPVSGRVVSLRARVGDTVRAGQTLAVIASRDVAEVKAALIRATAEERAAAGRLGTVRRMASSGALTDKPLEEARRDQSSTSAAMKQAQSGVTRARGACDVAGAELERVRKLAEAKAFQARPVEDAQRELQEAQLEVATAQASARVRRAAYERSQRLLDAGIAARRDVEAAEADFEEARAKQAEAEAHVSVAKRALAREESISGQDLHTVAEVRQAEDKVRQADRDLEVAVAELTRTRGHLTVSEAALSRERRIAGSQLNAKKELQEAEAQLSVARAEVAAAQSSLVAFRAAGGRQAGGLANIAIVAPLPGVVTERTASAGQAVEASTDLFVIQPADLVWVIARAYEKDLPRIGKGQEVEVRVKGYPKETFPGKVTLVSTALDEKSRTARIRCVVPNEAGVLRPGMFATVDIITAREKEVLLVPKDAVMDDAGKKVVFIVCNECPEDKPGAAGCGAYDKLEVQTGALYGNSLEITGGLEAGSYVVVAGQYQLKTAMGSGQLEAGCTDH